VQVVAAVLVLGGALLACKKKAPPPTEAPPAASTGPSAAQLEATKLLGELKERMKAFEKMATLTRTETSTKRDKPYADKVSGDELMVIGEKWIAEPRSDATSQDLDLKHTVLSLCSSMVYTEKVDESDTKYVRECLGFKWVAVVRTRKLLLPKVDVAKHKFTPGSVEGDVLLFDVSTSKIVGRYRLSTTNSDSVTDKEGTDEGEWNRQLVNDLKENLVAVVTERLKQERAGMDR
jgi:hypothetical protein